MGKMQRVGGVVVGVLAAALPIRTALAAEAATRSLEDRVRVTKKVFAHNANLVRGQDTLATELIYAF